MLHLSLASARLGARAVVGLSLTLAVAALAIGCGGPTYDHMTIHDVSQGDLATVVSLTNVSFPVGAAANVQIRPYNDDGAPMTGEVVSDSPSILEIAPGFGEAEFVFMGRTVGTTTVKFLADGQVVAIAKAEVTPQDAP
jgi:hypothetical protein